MPSFSYTSKSKLYTCDKRLIELFETVVKKYDCTIICGHRTQEDQDKAYNEGKSKLKYPKSKHNSIPSTAIDVAPYHKEKPHIRWDNAKDFVLFAGYVMGVAASMGIKIRWGGDWDGDFDMADQSFNDLPHFEILED